MRASLTKGLVGSAVVFLLSTMVLTPWTSAMLAGIVALASAPFALGFAHHRAALGLAVLSSTLALRSFAGETGTHLSLAAPPTDELDDGDASSHALVGSLIEERDVTMAGAVVFSSAGLLPRSDARGLVGALDAAYGRMRAGEGTTPSPLALTVLGVDSMLVVEPDGAPRDDLAVVFLHGYGGSFSVQCWHAARALRPLGARTLCPTVGFEGAWWSRRGDAVLSATLARLRSDGIDRVVLVGLSNGARGAAVLAERHPRAMAAVVLLSGGALVHPPPRAPVLALTGTEDTMFAPRYARRYAQAAGRRGTLVTLLGGHFVFLERFDEVEAEIATWLDTTAL